MKKLIYGALLLLAVPAFQSCIDDSESPSVTQQRQEKTKQIAALTELYQAQAYAERTIADAQAALLAAQEAKTKQEAQQAAVELERMKAELEYLKQKYQTDLMKALLEYYQYADAVSTQLVTNYSNACSKLAEVQENLISAQTGLAQLKADLVSAEMLNDQQLSEWQNLIARNELNIEQYKTFQEAFGKVSSLTQQQVEDSITAILKKIQELTYDKYMAQQEYNAVYNSTVGSNSAAYKGVWNSNYTNGLRAFAGLSNFNVGGTNYSYAPNVNSYSYFYNLKAWGTNPETGQWEETENYEYERSAFNQAYSAYYGYMQPTYVNGMTFYKFVPMFIPGPVSKSNTLKSTTVNGASVTYTTYTSLGSYLPEGFDSYFAYITPLYDNSDYWKNYYQQQYVEAGENLEEAQAMLASAEASYYAADAEWQDWQNTANQLFKALQDAQKAAGVSTQYTDAINEANAIINSVSPELTRVNQYVTYYQVQLSKATTAAQKEVLQAQLALSQSAAADLQAQLTAAKAQLQQATAAQEAYNKNAANLNAAVTAAQEAYNLWVYGDPTVGDTYNPVRQTLWNAYMDATTDYVNAELDYADAVTGYNRALNNWNAWKNNKNYAEIWMTVYEAVTADAENVSDYMNAFNEASLAAAQKGLVVSEIGQQITNANNVISSLQNQIGNNLSFTLPPAISATGEVSDIFNVNMTNVDLAILICEANIAYYQALIDNNTGTLDKEALVAKQEALIAQYQAEVEAWQAIVEAAKKALEDFLAE